MRRARARWEVVDRPAQPRREIERRAGEPLRVDLRRHRTAPPLILLTSAVLSAIVAGLPRSQRRRARRNLAGMVVAMLCAAFAAA